MTAMVALLEIRLGRLESDADAGGASDPCAAINRDACDRERELIATVHDSAARDSFPAGASTPDIAAIPALRLAPALRLNDHANGPEQVGTARRRTQMGKAG